MTISDGFPIRDLASEIHRLTAALERATGALERLAPPRPTDTPTPKDLSP